MLIFSIYKYFSPLLMNRTIQPNKLTNFWQQKIVRFFLSRFFNFFSISNINFRQTIICDSLSLSLQVIPSAENL